MDDQRTDRESSRVSRLEFFNGVKSACDKKIAFHGRNSFWQYLSDNLQYLIDLEQGTTSDRSRLKDIHIGGVAVHEIHGEDELTEQLCAVQAEIDHMIDEN